MKIVTQENLLNIYKREQQYLIEAIKMDLTHIIFFLYLQLEIIMLSLG